MRWIKSISVFFLRRKLLKYQKQRAALSSKIQELDKDREKYVHRAHLLSHVHDRHQALIRKHLIENEISAVSDRISVLDNKIYNLLLKLA